MGFRFEQTGKLLMLDDNTIRAAYELYVNQGIEGLAGFNYVSGLSYLTTQKQNELSSHIEQKLYANSKEIKEYVVQKYGINYSVEGIRKLLSRLDFVYKKSNCFLRSNTRK